MVRNGWNFHGDIAIKLEEIAKEYFGGINRPVNKIYDADCIEQYSFAEVMISILRYKTSNNNDNEAIEDFINKCSEYFGVSGNAIDQEIADNLFKEFQSLI